MKKTVSFFLIVLLVSGLFGCANTGRTAPAFDSLKKISYSNTFFELSEKKRNSTKSWRNGMISGNGMQGFVTSGSPYSDSIIYQNMRFVMPNDDKLKCPDFTNEIDAVRQAVVKGEDIVDDTAYHGLYCFHPGGALRLSQERRSFSDYVRYTNYETAEVGVNYTDSLGQWERVSFTSKADGVSITKITSSSNGSPVNISIGFDDLSLMANFGDGSEKDMKYKVIADEGGDYIALVSKYPDYENSELRKGGYATLISVIVEGGEKVFSSSTSADSQYAAETKPQMDISNAENVYLIAVSDRDRDMCDFADFDLLESFELVDSLGALADDVKQKYTVDGKFSYGSALEEHKKLFTTEYDALELDLNGADSTKSNEQLIKAQRKSRSLLPEMLQKAYYSGRYAYLCCSGYSAPRLYGMWTGEFCPGWGSKFTMDTNVNLQTSSMNSSNLASAPVGYIYLMLRQIPDWIENAKRVYGFSDAIQAPGHADGDCALMTETNYSYPFRFWNAGASWLIKPIYETLLTYGNIRIPLSDEFDLDSVGAAMGFSEKQISDIGSRGFLRLKQEVLLPMLTLSANFWVRFVSPEYYTDRDGKLNYEKGKKTLNEGEFYSLLPSYSPENNPSNYPSPSAANSAIDIAACRDNLEMYIDVCESLDIPVDEKYTDLLMNLPPYLYDETGALKEWETAAFEENNNHRHLSHLYCAWPLNETQNDDALREACEKALENRASECSASHALIFRALIADRLGDRRTVTKAFSDLMRSRIYYTSLMTNHNFNRDSCYCTDYELGYLGMVNEALVCSDSGEIDILPAVPESGFESGSIKGLRLKTRAVIDELTWDLEEGKVTVTITSDIDQDISVNCALSTDEQIVFCQAGKPVTVEFSLDIPD